MRQQPDKARRYRLCARCRRYMTTVSLNGAAHCDGCAEPVPRCTCPLKW
jgi:hypothetical protein